MASEAEADDVLAELKMLVPDPQVSNLIFWPQHDPRTRDVTEGDLTPDRIVDIAAAYRPIAL